MRQHWYLLVVKILLGLFHGLIEIMLVAQAVCQGQSLEDRRALVRIRFKLKLQVTVRDHAASYRNMTHQRDDIIQQMSLSDRATHGTVEISIDYMHVKMI